MDIIVKYIKKMILGSFLLYGFNMIALNFNLNIPINIWTTGFAGLFNLPGIALIILLKKYGV